MKCLSLIVFLWCEMMVSKLNGFVVVIDCVL